MALIKEAGRLDLVTHQVEPETEPQSAGDGRPPRKTAVGAGFSGNGGEIPPVFRHAFLGGFPGNDREPTQDHLDGDLIIALHGAPMDWIMDNIGPILEEYGLDKDLPVENNPRKINKFMSAARPLRDRFGKPLIPAYHTPVLGGLRFHFHQNLRLLKG